MEMIGGKQMLYRDEYESGLSIVVASTPPYKEIQ
jgi:hypothetical protein